MPRNLKTGYLTIGRSGPTVDGRIISPQMILDAAETYDPALFAALVWPEHFRFFNMGRVEAVRSVKNSEGGFDLQAVIAPNEYYLTSNSYDQKLFTSMEITENFRGTGKFYLTGLGATDSPASAATSEVRFSQEAGNSYRAAPQAVVLNPKPEKPSLFSRLFSDTEDEIETMNKAAITALAEELKALRNEFAALKRATDSAPTDPSPTGVDAEAFKALEKKVEELTAKFAELSGPGDGGSVKSLGDKLLDLEQRFNKALAEAHPGGTTPPQQTGNPAGEIVTDC